MAPILKVTQPDGHKARRDVSRQCEEQMELVNTWRGELSGLQRKMVTPTITRRIGLLHKKIEEGEKRAEDLAEEQRRLTLQYPPWADPVENPTSQSPAPPLPRTDDAEPIPESPRSGGTLKRKILDVDNEDKTVLEFLKTFEQRLEDKLEKRLEAIEEQQSSRHSSRRPSNPSSRSSSRTRRAGPQPEKITAEAPFGHVQLAPANVNGITHVPPNPTQHLDMQHILWPHLNPEMLAAIISNKIDATKLHTLIPMEFTAMLNAVPATSEDIFDRVKKLFTGVNSQDTPKPIPLEKIGKNFPTSGHWIIALETWRGVKSAFASGKGLWSASVGVHIGHLLRLTAIYGWPNVRNYEISFYARYHTIDDPTTWANEDHAFASYYLYHTPLEKRGPQQQQATSATRVSSMPLKDRIIEANELCYKFNAGKSCNAATCRYLHLCNLDPARCSGHHAAVNCHYNSSKSSTTNSNRYRNSKGTGSNSIAARTHVT
jgi:hypothetical protein